MTETTPPRDDPSPSHAALIAELATERQKRRNLAEALVGLLDAVTDLRQHETIKAAQDALAT